MHEMLIKLKYSTFVLRNFSNLSGLFKTIFPHLLALSLMLLLCFFFICGLDASWHLPLNFQWNTLKFSLMTPARVKRNCCRSESQL